MSLPIRSDSVSVRRLRVTLDPSAFDPVNAQLHAGRLLGGLDLRVHWLPPSSILCIRRVPDPRPRSLRLHAQVLRPPRDWELNLLGLVEEKARRAARPALGAVPADAEAVVFAD